MDFFTGRQLLGFLICLGGICMGVACAEGSGGGVRSEPKKDASEGGFAVVELFTSEGCSSCPPADAVMGKIVEDARRSGNRVFAIAFHVDYWDRLGWRDPFSSAQASKRQGEYARAFKNEQVYTPQMVVNGRVEFVGSEAKKAEAAISAALRTPAKLKVGVTTEVLEGRKVAVHYTCDPVAAFTDLHVVLVERGLTTKVGAGENGGRTLRHENVARLMETVALKDRSGVVTLTIPREVDVSQASVIVVAQDSRTMEVVGGDGVDVKPAAVKEVGRARE